MWDLEIFVQKKKFLPSICEQDVHVCLITINILNILNGSIIMLGVIGFLRHATGVYCKVIKIMKFFTWLGCIFK